MRDCRPYILVLAWVWLSLIGSAQPSSENQVNVTLGQSSVSLYGPWKFSIGDSPLDPATRQPLWAEPGFDDSRWETMDLTPNDSASDPITGTSGYVKGWASKGHPGYWGYAWYRIRIQVTAQPGERLAVGAPGSVDDVYQIFANGHLLGSFGDFSGREPVIYFSRPETFELPSGWEMRQAARPGELVLAIRLWMEPNTLHAEPDAGGFHAPLTFGDAGTIDASYQLQFARRDHIGLTRPLESVFFFLLSVVAVSLMLFDRADRVYLWMGAVFLSASVSLMLAFIAAETQLLSVAAEVACQDFFLAPITSWSWVMVWWVWFGLRRPAWIPRLAIGLAAVLLLSNALGEEVFFASIPHTVSSIFHWLSIFTRLAFQLLMVAIVVLGRLKGGREGWLALPAVLLISIAAFTNELLVLHVPTNFFPFGLALNIGDCANLLLVVVLSLLLLRRLLRSVRRQREIAIDVKQAQETQQVILPVARMQLPGFAIESVYRPAREVGGDFFQIIPHATDGSVLIVAGDVAGKGLKAGMLVALLVGAIRSTAEWNSEPEFLLRTLNRRLLGRGDATTTCLAMRLGANGAVTLANAGHVAPYLNGEAVAMEGALPLGIFDGAEFSCMNFAIAPADRLILISDGVTEAANEKGELLGFEGVSAMLRPGISASEVADRTQSFGQDDDISVITVTRTSDVLYERL